MIITPDNGVKQCIVRSAIGGLLYLTKFHWNMLEENENVILLVHYPGQEPKIFNSSRELLEDDLNKNLLFRVNNSNNVEDVNRIFNELEQCDFYRSHLLLVTSPDMQKKLFDQLEKQKNIKPITSASRADNNLKPEDLT